MYLKSSETLPPFSFCQFFLTSSASQRQESNHAHVAILFFRKKGLPRFAKKRRGSRNEKIRETMRWQQKRPGSRSGFSSSAASALSPGRLTYQLERFPTRGYLRRNLAGIHPDKIRIDIQHPQARTIIIEQSLLKRFEYSAHRSVEVPIIKWNDRSGQYLPRTTESDTGKLRSLIRKIPIIEAFQRLTRPQEIHRYVIDTPENRGRNRPRRILGNPDQYRRENFGKRRGLQIAKIPADIRI